MYGAPAGYGGVAAQAGGYNPYPTAGLTQPGTPAGADSTSSRCVSFSQPEQTLTRDWLPVERKVSGAVPLLPAQVTPGHNGLPAGYNYAGTPGTPGTPVGGASANRRAGPSRLQNVAYASPGVPGTPQPGVPLQSAASAAFLQQQQQMQAQQLRIAAHAQAQAAAQQQYATQQQLAQLQAAQQAHHQAQAAAVQAGNKRKREQDDAGRRAQDEYEGEAEGEDLTPYCFCHRPSFGEVRPVESLFPGRYHPCRHAGPLLAPPRALTVPVAGLYR